MWVIHQAIQKVNTDMNLECAGVRDLEAIKSTVRKASGLIFNMDNHVYYHEGNVVIYEWPHILYQEPGQID